MLNYGHQSGIECVSCEMFKVLSSLVHRRLKMLAKVLNSPCHSPEEGSIRQIMKLFVKKLQAIYLVLYK